MVCAYINNPRTDKGEWFDFPLCFGKLSRIGHSGSYDDPVEVLTIEGDPSLRCGIYTFQELDRLNAGI